MANQITIDIGAAANDGTGDPLRTAFNYVNNNFSNVWNTGLPNSNVQFLDNRILTVNTNANLVLAPNGIGKVASNVDIVPNTANVFALGSSTRRWNTVYGQYLDLSHNAIIGGNLTVTGNLSAGNISYTSNVFVGDLEGSVFDGASSIVLDVIDSAIYVDNYYYANGVPFGGGGNYGNTNVATFLAAFGSNSISTTGNISAGNASVTNVVAAQNITATAGTFTGDQFSDGAMYIGSPAGTVLGSDVVIQITANSGSYSQTNFQNINPGGGASSDYILTADNGNNITHFLDMGITSSGWDGSETNVLSGLTPNNGYLYVQDGNLSLGVRNGNTSYSWKFDTTGTLTVGGDIATDAANLTLSVGISDWVFDETGVLTAPGEIETVGNISAGYFLGNGSQLTGLADIGNLAITGTDISIAAGAPDTLINISPSGEGWAYLQLPKDASANSANTRLHNDAGNVEIGTGNFSTGSSSYEWVFDNTGVLTAPGNISATGNIVVSPGVGTLVFGRATATGSPGMSSTSSLTFTANRAGTTKEMSFNTAGDFSVPGIISTTANIGGGNISATGNISTDGYISAGNIGVSTTITTQTLVTDPGPLSGLTAAWGARGFITDGNLVAVGNFGAQVAGGGGNSVPVWSDGVNWFIG